MSLLARELKFRVRLEKGTVSSAAGGSVTQSYEELLTIWAGMRNPSSYVKYLRLKAGENLDVDSLPDVVFVVRLVAVATSLGSQFSPAFSPAFDSIVGIIPVERGMFIFLPHGTGSAGRRYEILAAKRDELQGEWMEIEARFIHETGTGQPL